MRNFGVSFLAMVLTLGLGVSSGVFAEGTQKDAALMGDDYFKIAAVEVALEEAPYEVADQFLGNDQKGVGEVIMVADQLLALGKKIWVIIEAGRPVVSTNLPVVSVIPRELGQGGSPYDLEGWRAPKSIGYRVTYKNFYGMEVISFTYSLSFQPGGQLNGKGAYIAGATVSANRVSVAWGFNFDAKSEVVSITNRGSKLAPVAGLTLRISYVAKSVLSDIRNSYSYHMTGNGDISEVDGY